MFKKFMTHFVVVAFVAMAIALATSMFLMAHIASVVSVAFGSGFVAGLFLGIYGYRVITKTFH